MLPFLAIEDFNSSPPRDFILPLYVKAQAQVFVCYVSPPRVRNPLNLYDFAIKVFINDKVQE
jgi:hypothetical protein